MSVTEPDGGYSAKPQARSLRPRRRLPSGRAVVGALMVTVAGVGAFTLADRGSGDPGELYLVASEPIEQGAAVSLGDLALAPMLLPAVVAANAVSSADGLEGSIAVRDLVAGDLITAGDLIAAPSADGAAVGAIHEMSMPVEHDRISDRTAAGDRVTVLATLDASDDPFTIVAAEDVRVLGWSGGSESASSRGVLKLALDDAASAMSLAHLSRRGSVTVIRTTRAVTDAYPAYVATSGLIADLGAESADPGTPDYALDIPSEYGLGTYGTGSDGMELSDVR